MKNLSKTSILGVVLVLLLTACNKQEEPSAPTQKSVEGTGVVNPTKEQLDAMNGSPTIGTWTAGMKLGATLMLLEKHPKMTPAEQDCLLGVDADKAYFENSKREMLAVLGEDGIKKADDFYSSDVGKKVAQLSQEQMAIVAGKKIDKPTVLSDDEKAKMEEFMASEMMQKMRQNIATISPEKMEADLAVIAEKEAARCGLPDVKLTANGDSDTKPNVTSENDGKK